MTISQQFWDVLRSHPHCLRRTPLFRHSHGVKVADPAVEGSTFPR
jgi:hypothetical protein